MKTANFLSVTAFLVLAGLMTVGCSTPAVTEIDDNASAASGDDDDDAEDDDDDNTSAKTSKKKNDSAATNPKPAGDDDADDDDDATGEAPTSEACTSCFAKNAKAKKLDECSVACKDDQQCAEACFTSSGCEQDQACMSVLEECDKVCGGAGEAPAGDDDDDTPPGEEGSDPCMTCIGTGPARSYIQCLDQQQCQDQQCDSQCFEQACGGNEQACDSKLGQCENQCFGGQ